MWATQLYGTYLAISPNPDLRNSRGSGAKPHVTLWRQVSSHARPLGTNPVLMCECVLSRCHDFSTVPELRPVRPFALHCLCGFTAAAQRFSNSSSAVYKWILVELSSLALTSLHIFFALLRRKRGLQLCCAWSVHGLPIDKETPGRIDEAQPNLGIYFKRNSPWHRGRSRRVRHSMGCQ